MIFSQAILVTNKSSPHNFCEELNKIMKSFVARARLPQNSRIILNSWGLRPRDECCSIPARLAQNIKSPWSTPVGSFLAAECG